MTETDSGRVGRALRIGGLAVLVVLAVVAARARAAGMTPPVEAPAKSLTEVLMRIGALTIMVAAMILLLWFKRPPKVLGAAVVVRKGKKKPGQVNRRVVIACLIGLLFAVAMQLLGNATQDKKEAPPPPPPSASEVQTDPNARDRGKPQAGKDSSIADEILLVVAALALGGLIFVLVRRDTVVLDADEEDEEEEAAMARAVRAGREAVADRTITDPREAIVACFAAMESALADRGGAVTPQDADTPWEVLHRGIESASLPEGAASTLLRLFREARYSTHPMAEQDRTDADTALSRLLGTLTGGPR